jgi:hypothetical protein
MRPPPTLGETAFMLLVVVLQLAALLLIINSFISNWR